MKNDLVLNSDIQQCFPTLVEGLRRAQSVFDAIKSFQDLERVFLQGAGLSTATYRSYLTAVRQFYEFTGGKHPLQVRPGDIEAFYDHILEKVDRNTAYLRIRGLKRFFSGIRNVVPFYTSPFEVMPEKLHQKLNRTKKGNRTKKALSAAEIKRLLAWLREDTSIKGLENYAITFMLLTSGLRSAELMQLTWGDLDCFEGAWSARFIGKGGKEAEQELYPVAVDACRRYFIVQHGRNPHPEDALFWTLPSFPGEEPRPMQYHGLWHRINQLGAAARQAGILKRDLQFSPHLFRRSYATLLYKSGMGLKAIQGKTRHASMEVLVKHYIHDDEPATPYFERMLA